MADELNDLRIFIDTIIERKKGGYEYYRPEEMRNYTSLLTIGMPFVFAGLPNNDKTMILLKGLKECDFVSKDTTIEHFRVLFGIPLHTKDTPFEPIKWRKNKQLLRYFIYAIFPKRTIYDNKLAIVSLFADKHGCKIVWPESDRKRLEQSYEYPTLVNLLNNFNA